MSLWDKVQASAKAAGDATKVAAHKTKLRTDMLMIDRDIRNRKKEFGVAMYDHVSPLSQSQDFYAASDELTNILRPHLITAQKEIQALAAKRVQLKEALATAEVKRAAAFPTKAEGVGQKLLNFGKAGVMHSEETKLKAELALVDRRIKGHKQSFGLDLFQTLSDAEDARGYLPSDRQVRNIYDACRAEIQKMEANKKQKMDELKELGVPESDITTPSVVENSNTNTSSTYGDFSGTSSYQAPSQTQTYGSYSDNNQADGSDDLLL